MNKLSEETLSCICSLLQKPDFCHFRLVCKRFSQISAKYVRTWLALQMTDRDLQRLFELSREPRLAKGLRSLHYAPVNLMQQSNYRDLQGVYCQSLYPKWEPEYPHHRKSKLVVRNRSPSLLVLIQEQAKIIQANYDFMCLLSAFSRFPFLEHITLYFGKEYLSDSSSTTRAGTRHLQIVLTIISELQLKITSLSLYNIDWRFFDGKSDAELHALFRPAANLKELHLVVNNLVDGKENRSQVQNYVSDFTRMYNMPLRKCLPALTKLHTLNLSFTSTSTQWDAGVVSLDQVIPPGLTWTHLERLQLANVSCDRQELMEFLRRHRETLRALCLKDVSLKQTSWIPLLANIRRELHLIKPCVCGMLASRSEDEVQWFQFWQLPRDTGEKDTLYRQLNRYLERGGEAYLKMKDCPLTEQNATRQ